ncbi:MAG: toxin-antitoxin system YwqK family antitoxin [Patescibacteria group bacterium]
MLTKENLVEALTLHLAGAAKYYNNGEIECKDITLPDEYDLTITFPTNNPKLVFEKVYYKSGTKYRERTYKNYKLCGQSTCWYETGELYKQKNYKNGKLDGSFCTYYIDGKKEEETIYTKGLLEGKYTKWYPTGQVQAECHHIHNVSNGLYNEWYENGQKRNETLFKNGYRHGKDAGWHSNGNKAREAHYRDGKVCGVFRSWSFSGQPLRHLKIDKNSGGIIEGLEWYGNGTLKFKKTKTKCTLFSIKNIKITEIYKKNNIVVTKCSDKHIGTAQDMLAGIIHLKSKPNEFYIVA